MTIHWEEHEEPLEAIPLSGNPKGAGLVVTVKDGEIMDMECLCAACQEAFGSGILEAFGGPLPEGITYVRFWHDVTPATPNGPAEHSTGLCVNE
jgi:hypothetical protein